MGRARRAVGAEGAGGWGVPGARAHQLWLQRCRCRWAGRGPAHPRTASGRGGGPGARHVRLRGRRAGQQSGVLQHPLGWRPSVRSRGSRQQAAGQQAARAAPPSTRRLDGTHQRLWWRAGPPPAAAAPRCRDGKASWQRLGVAASSKSLTSHWPVPPLPAAPPLCPTLPGGQPAAPSKAIGHRACTARRPRAASRCRLPASLGGGWRAGRGLRSRCAAPRGRTVTSRATCVAHSLGAQAARGAQAQGWKQSVGLPTCLNTKHKQRMVQKNKGS